MTLPDLTLVAAFWLLLMLVRPWLSVDPRYRGKRRRGGERYDLRPLGVAGELTAPVAPPHAIGYHHHLPPYVPAPVVPAEETGELTAALQPWEKPAKPGTYRGGWR